MLFNKVYDEDDNNDKKLNVFIKFLHLLKLI